MRGKNDKTTEIMEKLRAKTYCFIRDKLSTSKRRPNFLLKILDVSDHRTSFVLPLKDLNKHPLLKWYQFHHNLSWGEIRYG